MGNMSGNSGGHYTLSQSIKVNSQDINNNTSNVTVTMNLTFDGSSYYAYTYNSSSGTMTIDGNTTNYSISNIVFSSGVSKTITLATWTGDISHNSDGTKTLSVSGYWNTDTTLMGSGNCNNSLVLSTIPRASQIISFSGTNIEGSFSVKYNSYSNNFTNKLRISIPNVKMLETFDYTNETVFKLSSDTISYLYDYMANSKTVNIGAVIETYNGSTKIGESSEIINVCYITDCEPTVTYTLTDTNSVTTELTGDEKILILNASTAQLIITSTLNKNAGSISSVKVNNINVGTNSSITKTYQNVSVSSFTIIVTDSRGYSTTVTAKPSSIVNYIPLTINANIYRPQPTTGEISLNYNGNVYNGSFGNVTNELTVNYQYKLSSDTSYTEGTETITPTLKNNTYSLSETSLGTIFTYTNKYDFKLTVSDKINSITYNTTVLQGIPIYQWNSDTFQVNGNLLKNGSEVLDENSLGLLTSNLTQTISNTTTDSGWSMINSTYKGFLLKSLRMNSSAPNWLENNYSAGIAFGGHDTKGVISHAYGTPAIKFAGGNGTKPVWWIRLLATSGCSYTLPSYSGYTLETKPTQLYNNTSGTTGTVTLSSSSANYTYLEIFYGKDSRYSSVKIYSPNGKMANLQFTYPIYTEGTNYLQVNSSTYTISGTSITKGLQCFANAYIAGSGWINFDTETTCKIYRVIGYK